MSAPADVDAVVVGGGIFGCVVASHLRRRWRLARIVLLEREPLLLARASLRNQARVHNGYHYPRSFTTAFRSRYNLPRFLAEWADAVVSDFTAVYAVSRLSSSVSARQFVRFCGSIGASVEPTPSSIARLFDPRTVEASFVVLEPAFDAVRLRDVMGQRLRADGVEVVLNTQARAVQPQGRDLRVEFGGPGGDGEARAPWVFNCTYSALNWFAGSLAGVQTRIKHEAAELALVRVPTELTGLAVTVMDGPFFSLFPYPSLGLHTLSHVRYTPHAHWPETPGVSPYVRLAGSAWATRFDRMRRDALRYLPPAADLAYAGSLFEVKSVLVSNEVDDGRPILLERHSDHPGLVSILGGKIDNIYDVLDSLDALMAGDAREAESIARVSVEG